MNNQHCSRSDLNRPATYHIRLRGHLAGHSAAWFAGLTVTLEDSGDTLLAGPVPDQAALHGLLRTVRDLGLPLLLVLRVDASGAAAPAVERS